MKLLIAILFPLFSFSQIKVDQKMSILNGKVEFLVPKELSKITDEIWKIKYGNAKQPVLALSDKDGEANLIGQMTNQDWEEANLDEYKNFRIENLKKTRPNLKVLEEGNKEINGKKVVFFKFMTEAVDTKIFNYYFFTVVNGKILIFTFNCPEKLKSSWETVGDQIVSSLKIN